MPQGNGVVNGISGTVIGNVVQAGSVSLIMEPRRGPVALDGLPPQPVFVGRDVETGAVLDLLRPDAPADAATVLSVGGFGGIGKTALIVHAARHAVDNGWFPGGILMIDMRGYQRGGRQLTPSAALASLLSAMGVRAPDIPVGLDGRTRLWRSILAHESGADQRVLIVIDNVSDARQVTPLLPGTNSHRVLVTSRARLAGLQGVRLLDLTELPDDPAVTLLATELRTADAQDRRVADDPAAAARIASLCGGVPLAIRTAAALLVTDPGQPLAELAGDLEDERQRLTELHVSADLSVRAAATLSYQRLTPEQARVFRLLSLNPGPEFATDAVAALADTTAATAKRLLRGLLQTYLIMPGSRRGRWRMHDLLRLFASELAERDDEHPAAVTRLLEYYRTHTTAAAATLDPRHGHDDHRADALAWLDLEQPNLLPAIGLATATGRTEFVRDLPLALDRYFELRRNTGDWLTAAASAVRAARELGDRTAEAHALTSLGNAHLDAEDHDEAMAHQTRALTIARELGDRFVECRALANIGNVHLDRRTPDQAIAVYRESLAIREELGDEMGVYRLLSALALAYRDHADATMASEDVTTCIAYYEQALAGVRRLGDRRAEAITMHNLAEAYGDLYIFDHRDTVEQLLRSSVDVFHDLGDSHGEAVALHNLGTQLWRMDRRDEAQVCQERAEQLRNRTGRPVYFDRRGPDDDFLSLPPTPNK